MITSPPRRIRLLSTSIGLLLMLSAALGACGTTKSSDGHDAQVRSGSDRSLSMVVIGDSIPMNSAADCPGCRGFVVQYAAAIEKSTGKKVVVSNLAEHTNVTLPDLVSALPDLSDQLEHADIILVGIAHNSFELNADEPCGAALVEDNPDWSAVTPACGVRAAAKYAPMFDKLYASIAKLRANRKTMLRTINRYDDWVGSPGIPARDTALAKSLVDAWDKVICDAAKAHAFDCVDLHRAMNGPHGTQSALPLLTDGIHPNQKGNDLIAKSLANAGFAPLAAS